MNQLAYTLWKYQGGPTHHRYRSIPWEGVNKVSCLTSARATAAYDNTYSGMQNRIPSRHLLTEINKASLLNTLNT